MKHPKLKSLWHLLLYTIIFSGLFFLCYGIYYLHEGKSYLWAIDGLAQHYALFFYTRRFLHGIIHTLLAGNGLQIPMWDFSIGYGSDIFITLGVGLFDPFNWVAALVPYKAVPEAFDIVVVLKMYCAGLSFLAFSKHKSKNFGAALAGSIVYVFSAGMFIGFFHSDFINAFYIFPLLMIGVERFWERRGAAVYIFLLAFAFLNSFYFGYMMSILILGYCVLRMLFEHLNWKEALVQVGRFLGASLLGVGISMFAVLPVIMNLAGTDRLTVKRTIPFFYDQTNERAIFQGLFSSFNTGRDAFIGVLGVTLIAMVILLMRKGHTFLKTSWVLLTILLFIPYFGHIMNGMSYASHRWVFAHVFISAYLVSTAFQCVEEFDRKDWLATLVVCFAYSIVAILCGAWQRKTGTISLAFGFGIPLVFLLVLVYISKEKRRVRTVLAVMMTVSSAVLNSYYYFRPCRDNWSPVPMSVDKDQATEACYRNGALYLLDDIPRDQGIRYDEDFIDRVNNSSWAIAGIGGMDFYEPYYNNDIDRYNSLLGIVTNSFPTSYFGLNGRSELEALCGVRYYMTPQALAWARPEIYSNLYSGAGEERCLYQTDRPISMAYYFNRTLSDKDFQSLSMYERQKAMMQGIILEKESAEDSAAVLKMAEREETDSILDSIQAKGNAVWRKAEKSLEVNKAGSGLEIRTKKGKRDGEIYLSLKNLRMIQPSAQIFQIKIRLLDSEGTVLGERKFSEATILHHMYGGRTDWLINMGTYHNSSVSKVEILFDNKGLYSVDNINVILNPESEIEKNIDSLRPVTSALSYGINQMTLGVDAEKAEYLLLTVPYSKGWSATIKGKEIPIQKADQAFMALKLPKGKYNIEFHYHTPWQEKGIGLSLLCFIATVCLLAIHHRNREIKEIKEK